MLSFFRFIALVETFHFLYGFIEQFNGNILELHQHFVDGVRFICTVRSLHLLVGNLSF